MCFSRNKRQKRDDKKFAKTATAAALKEKDFLRECVREAEYLKEYLTTPDEIEKMNAIIDDLTYANVSADDVSAVDKRIENALDDLKILLNKKKRDSYDIAAALDRIAKLTAERATY